MNRVVKEENISRRVWSPVNFFNQRESSPSEIKQTKHEEDKNPLGCKDEGMYHNFRTTDRAETPGQKRIEVCDTPKNETWMKGILKKDTRTTFTSPQMRLDDESERKNESKKYLENFVSQPALETPRPPEGLFQMFSNQTENERTNETPDVRKLGTSSDMLDEPTLLEIKDLGSVEQRHQIRRGSSDTVQHFCAPCVEALYNFKQNNAGIHKEPSFKPERFTKKTDVDTWWT
ncbi:hypothetical protein BpHYR1_002008, partial [Brachionus plicatilis]